MGLNTLRQSHCIVTKRILEGVTRKRGKGDKIGGNWIELGMLVIFIVTVSLAKASGERELLYRDYSMRLFQHYITFVINYYIYIVIATIVQSEAQNIKALNL